MKSATLFETTRMSLPAAITSLRAAASITTSENVSNTAAESASINKSEQLEASAVLALTRNRRIGEELALTMHFNDEKITLERQVEQNIKKLQTQLKLLHTDLLPSPVRPRVNYIEELISYLIKDFKQLLIAQTTEIELYTHRVGSAQLQAEYAKDQEEEQE